MTKDPILKKHCISFQDVMSIIEVVALVGRFLNMVEENFTRYRLREICIYSL